MTEKVKKGISNQRNIFWFLSLCAALLLGLYLYFVSDTVYDIVTRQKTEKSATAIESGITNLESQYLSMEAGITAELAKTKGFTDISSATYIPRKTLGKGLSLNNEI